MSIVSRCRLAAVAWLSLWALPAWAVDSLTWEDLQATAASAYSSGPGAVNAAMAEGLDAAAARPQRGPSSIWAQVQRGLPAQDQLTVAVDVPLTLGLAESRAGHAEADALRADNEAEQMRWTTAVVDTWLDGWAARENALHLTEYEHEIESWLEPLRQASAAGLISALDLAELQAELARVRAERAASEAQAASVDATLSAMLGRPVRVDPGREVLHDAPRAEANPWPALVALASVAPGVQAAQAGARAADAQVQASWAAGLPVVSLGGMSVPSATGPRQLAYVGIAVPLRTDGAAQRATSRGHQHAHLAQARWEEAQFRAGIEAESMRWEAARSQYAVLSERLIEPLEQRQASSLAAFRQAMVPAERLIRARRDLHEAHHEQLQVLAALLSSEARAYALQQALPASGER